MSLMCLPLSLFLVCASVCLSVPLSVHVHVFLIVLGQCLSVLSVSLVTESIVGVSLSVFESVSVCETLPERVSECLFSVTNARLRGTPQLTVCGQQCHASTATYFGPHGDSQDVNELADYGILVNRLLRFEDTSPLRTYIVVGRRTFVPHVKWMKRRSLLAFRARSYSLEVSPSSPSTSVFEHVSVECSRFACHQQN